MNRQEAINIVKKNWPDSSFTSLKEALESLIPELMNTDDEKIKEAIIKGIIHAAEEGCFCADNYSVKECVAWVEKQGEHKPIIEMKSAEESLGIDSETYNKIVDECIYGEQNPKWTPMDEQRVENLLAIIEEHGYPGEVAWLNSLKDRVQPNPAWSEEDETTKNNISHIIRQYDKISKRENQPCYYVGDCLLWMQNIKDRVQPQIKQEWSEEDAMMLQYAVDFVSTSPHPYAGDTLRGEKGKDEVINWLKSLKDRVQPKQEWSEEDKDFIERLLDVTELWANGKSVRKPYSTALMYQEWLKSLRPQKQWKPSEGQLECLGYAIEKAEKDWSPLTNNRIYLTLKALKEQLEKL